VNAGVSVGEVPSNKGFATFSFMAFGSKGHIPEREKPATTCLGVNADSYSCLNKEGKSIFRIVFLPLRVKYFETTRFHACLPALNDRRKQCGCMLQSCRTNQKERSTTLRYLNVTVFRGCNACVQCGGSNNKTIWLALAISIT
jgi:hypothetical protein